MPKVMKANKQLTVDETLVDAYLSLGYSEIDDKGEIIQHGKADTLKDIKAENETLKAQLSKLKDIEAENEKLKAELEVLKADKKSK